MKKLAIALLAVSVAGCASIPQQTQPTAVHHKVPAVKQVAKPVIVSKSDPVEATTPNQTVKKRWYDRFLKHKSK